MKKIHFQSLIFLVVGLVGGFFIARGITTPETKTEIPLTATVEASELVSDSEATDGIVKTELVYQESIRQLSAENETLRQQLQALSHGKELRPDLARRIITPAEDTRAMREGLTSEYFELSMQRDMIEQSIESSFSSLVSQSEDPELIAGILAITQKYFAWDQLETTFYDLYADTFSSQELADIVSFYQTPAGRMYAEKQTELAVKTAQVTQQLMLNNQGEISREIHEFMTQLMQERETRQKDTH